MTARKPLPCRDGIPRPGDPTTSTAARIALCDDCPAQQLLEGDICACRELPAPNGAPCPRRWAAVITDPRARCPLGRWTPAG